MKKRASAYPSESSSCRKSSGPKPPVRLFVYGTLMQGEASHRLLATLPGARFVGHGWVDGRLVDLVEYPGAIHERAANDRFVGELWEFDSRPGVLRTLDDHEGFYPEQPAECLFTRRRAAVHLERRTVRAWVYFLSRRPESTREVRGNDWRGRRGVNRRSRRSPS